MKFVHRKSLCKVLQKTKLLDCVKLLGLDLGTGYSGVAILHGDRPAKEALRVTEILVSKNKIFRFGDLIKGLVRSSVYTIVGGEIVEL
ncbi:hypothetical protein LWI29_006960 [Acer saccharum]|uniref:Uncharacterized protein n=1 Tax=Acer saccharum TaxID=4024 RepID=A0AA39TC20_ACESA|nr:hypothetical protein LWI29_006960 [Acer saccharum]